MKKYPILIGLVGLIGISIARVSSISSATATLSIDKIRVKIETNPLAYALVLNRVYQLFSDYDKLLKQYKAATSPVTRDEIQVKIDKIKTELNKLIS